MVIFLSFVIGIFLGSFLNVLIDRLSTDRPFVKGRSYCENCKKTLKPIDLIPLVSYILLRGKCRFCHKKIPFRLFFVEALVGVTAVALSLAAGPEGLWPGGGIGITETILLGIILFCFIGIFFADIIYGIIPDLLVIVSAVASLAFVLLSGFSIQNHLLAGIGSLVFFLLLFVLTKGRGMGFGDVKLSFVLGLLLGFPGIIVSLYLAFLTGAGVSIILVICRKLKFFGSTIPFGPFMVLSAIVALFWGDIILQSFVSRFL